MPFGCFGKRKKKEKSAADGAANDAAPVVGATSGGANTGATSGATNNGGTTNGDAGAEVNESVVAARAQGQQLAAPGNIQKSATLARYDFLRKSDYVNSADRWAALKEQYLAPKMTQSQHGGQLGPSDEPSSAPPAASNGPPALGRGSGGRGAQSLPRQFSPPSTVVSVVKFSHWFYERQIKEEEARREAQEREEKSRRLFEGLSMPDSGPDAEAAAAAAETIQAGFRGFKTRQLLQEHRQQQRQEADEEQHQLDSQAATAAHTADEEAAAAARIQAGFRGYQTRKHLAEAKEHEHEQHDQQPQQHEQNEQHHQLDDLDESDPRVNEAATKIQAGFKGMRARKEVKELRKHKEEDAAAAATAEHNDEHDDSHHHGNEEHTPNEMDAAAAKIQAGFKGYKTRKELGLLHHHEPHGDQPGQQSHPGDQANS